MGICGSTKNRPREDVEPQSGKHEPNIEAKYNVEVVSNVAKRDVSPSVGESEDILQMEHIVQTEKLEKDVNKSEPELALVAHRNDLRISPVRLSARESESSVKLLENAAVTTEKKRESYTKEPNEPLQTLTQKSENILPPSGLESSQDAEEAKKGDDVYDAWLKDSSEMIMKDTSDQKSKESSNMVVRVLKANDNPVEIENTVGGGEIPDVDAQDIQEDSSRVDENANHRQKLTAKDNITPNSLQSVGVLYSDEFQAGESGTATDKNTAHLEQPMPAQAYDSLSDVPSVPMASPRSPASRPSLLRTELSSLQNTFKEFRKMKVGHGHASSLLKEQEQTLMEGTTEIHTLLELYETTSDPNKQLEIEIIMDRKFELLSNDFGAYYGILNNDDESSMLLDMTGDDLFSPLADFDETSEEVPPPTTRHLSEEHEIMKLASIPLVAFKE